MGCLVISAIAFVVLFVEVILAGFFAMIMANGYMGGTDPMVTAYVVCQGAGLLVLSLLSGPLAGKLSQAWKMPLWLGGLLTVGAAAVLMFVLSFFSFAFAIAFFAP
jgi:hypothetical protein